MKAHELAKLLLDGPDLPVCIDHLIHGHVEAKECRRHEDAEWCDVDQGSHSDTDWTEYMSGPHIEIY